MILVSKMDIEPRMARRRIEKVTKDFQCDI